jgi:hypothetical protein
MSFTHRKEEGFARPNIEMSNARRFTSKCSRIRLQLCTLSGFTLALESINPVLEDFDRQYYAIPWEFMCRSDRWLGNVIRVVGRGNQRQYFDRVSLVADRYRQDKPCQ